MPEKSTSSLVQTLRKIALFKGLSPSLIQKILSLCAPHSYPPGEKVCVGGDNPSDEMYVLLSGKLAIMSAEGLRVATVTPVAIVGEMGFITRQVRSATVEAVHPSRVLTIAKTPFDNLLRGDRDMQVVIYRNIIDILCGKLVDDNIRTRDYLIEQAGYESRLNAYEQRLELALEMLAEHEVMSPEEARSYLDEKMVEINPRILVVDDEVEIRRLLKQVLAPFVVMEAGSGPEALDVARKGGLDLVITDIKMPGMDGFSLLTHLHDQYPDLPVLALSGVVGADEIQDSAFAAFIEKPIRLRAFRTVVEETLGRDNPGP